MEKFNLQPSAPEPISSREGMVLKKLNQYLTENDLRLEDLSEEEALLLLSEKKFKFPGTTPESVVAQIPSQQFRQPVVEEVEKLAPAEPEMISNRRQLQGITEVEDDEIRQQLEQNHFFEELSNNIFKNDKDIDVVYEQALSLEKNHPIEGKEYYEDFADLVEGGTKEIENDLQSLAERQELFKNKVNELEEGEAKKSEKMKKIATIVEYGIAHAVTNLGWYGDNVSIEPVSQFDDVKRGVDGVLQIREEGEQQNTFLGLGVDATYRGLLSKEYKEKFAKLLNSIDRGFKTKIKYFKNHQGQMMKEFTVPKIVLYFDNADIKNLVAMVRDSMEPDASKDFKNDPQKVAVMNQILVQCQLLADFAEECNNNVFENYNEFIDAVKRLGEENPEIQEMIDSSSENEVSTHMKYLINEFKKGV